MIYDDTDGYSLGNHMWPIECRSYQMTLSNVERSFRSLLNPISLKM